MTEILLSLALLFEPVKFWQNSDSFYEVNGCVKESGKEKKKEKVWTEDGRFEWYDMYTTDTCVKHESFKIQVDKNTGILYISQEDLKKLEKEVKK